MARLPLVVGLAVAVASPSFVDRRAPSFAELFERFRSNDMSVEYLHSFYEEPGFVQLAKSGDSYLRLGVARSTASTEAPDQFTVTVTPSSARLCQISVIPTARTTSLAGCTTETSLNGRQFLKELAMGALGFPRALRDAAYGRNIGNLPMQRQDDRVVLGRTSTCFGATPEPYEGTFKLCFDERGVLLYARVDDGLGQITLEATRVADSVDMSVFD